MVVFVTTEISHLNLINSLGTSSSNLESSKCDKLLVSVSSTTSDNKTITLGTSSSNLETNKCDKLLVSVSSTTLDNKTISLSTSWE